jgi:membrane associated rhomboid family serine protease
MDPLALTTEALREPWRLWTGHLVHFGWEHALANLIALAVPTLLVARRERGRLLLVLLLAAPLLSLLLLPGLGQGQYRGASGLACVAWSWVGLRLAARRESFSLGLAVLGGLALKLALEAAFGTGPLAAHPDWQSLPAVHFWGALLGLAAVLPSLRRSAPATPHGT